MITISVAGKNWLAAKFSSVAISCNAADWPLAGGEVEVGDSIGPWVGMLGIKGVGDGSAANAAGVGVARVGAAAVGVSRG